MLLISILEEYFKEAFLFGIIFATIGTLISLAFLTLFTVRYVSNRRRYNEERQHLIEAEKSPASTVSKKD